MNKKLLTMAVGAALASGAAVSTTASADVTVYGQAQVELAKMSYDYTYKILGVKYSYDYDGLTVKDNARGRFGVKASEDLGGGLSAFAKFEWKVDTTTSGGLTGREKMVGLKGAFGSVMAGDLKTPYKYFGGVGYDAFVTTNLEARGNGGMSGKVGAPDQTQNCMGHNAFCNDMIGYKGKFGPVEVWLDYGFEQNGNSDGTTGNDGDYSFGVKAGQGPWEVFVAINHDEYLNGNELPGATSYDYDATKIGGSFKMGAHKFMLQHEIIADENQGAAIDEDFDTNLTFFAWNMGMGKTTLVAQVGLGDYDANAPVDIDDESTYLAIGAIHKLSKTARIFGGIRQSNFELDAPGYSFEYEEQAISIGMRKDF